MVLVNLHIEVHRNAVNLMMLSKNCVLWVNTPNGKMLNSGQEIKVERWARERERERDGGRGSGGKFELDRVLSKIGGWGQKWVCGDRKKNQCSSLPELVSSFHASSFPQSSLVLSTPSSKTGLQALLLMQSWLRRLDFLTWLRICTHQLQSVGQEGKVLSCRVRVMYKQAFPDSNRLFGTVLISNWVLRW